MRRHHVQARRLLSIEAMKQLVLFTLLLASSIPLTAGCSAQSDTEVDSAYVPSDTVEIVASSRNSFAPNPPEGSTCRGTDDTFTFRVATRELSFRSCRRQASRLYDYSTGSRVLSVEEAKPVIAALNAVRAPDRKYCAEDVGATSLRVATSAGANELIDAQNACNEAPGTYVDGIDDVLSAMRPLTKAP
jgi:hypothetical protein